MSNAVRNPIEEKFEQFYRMYYHEEISELAKKYPNEKRSLFVEYLTLFQFDADLARDFVESPVKVRRRAEKALEDYDLPVDVKLSDAHVRLVDIPEPTAIRDIRIEDDEVGRLIAVEGVARKVTDVRPKIVEAAFECSRCGTLNWREQDDGQYEEPTECHGCEREGPFSINFDESVFVDAQKIRVQERPESLHGSETPQSIDIYIEDDITGKVTPGNKITVTGVLKIDQIDSDSAMFDLYLDGRSVAIEDNEIDGVEIDKEDIEQIEEWADNPEVYEMLAESVAPKIFGLKLEKLAITLQLFGGVRKELPDGSKIRGDFHLLLIGDPGKGKSALLAYAKEISPRAVYTSGKGSSAAGLTASAVKSNFSNTSNWTLEAGALVLADGGVAAVDEIDKMASSDRSAMHEALEQQTVTVSKAGIQATLQSRCSLLAAANPKYGAFDTYEPIAEQIDIEPALLSRFDLIFTVVDNPDPDFDGKLADHVLSANEVGEMKMQYDKTTNPSVTEQSITEEGEEVNPQVSKEMFRKYISYAKQKAVPAMSKEAREEIKEFYVDLRGTAERDDPVPLTARKLEALVRLAEASARIRLSNTVDKGDAERAIKIVRTCLEDVGIDPETGEMDADTVETGTTNTQRNRINTVKGIITELESESDGGVPIADIIEEAEKIDIDQADVRQEIESMRHNGDLYEPEYEKYKTA
jgi:replicative DNA helicase Mcm